MVGRIRFWNDQKGYGFIVVRSGEQYFFHIANFENNTPELPLEERRPRLSQIVQFELGAPIREGKSTQAVNVKPVTLADIESGTKALASEAGV